MSSSPRTSESSVSGPRLDRSRSAAPAIEEVAVYVACDREHLGGVVTLPSMPSSLGVILMGGHARDRVHKNGPWVKTAKDLAHRGLHSLRVDYPGAGHSSGPHRGFDLEDPPTWAVVGAARFLLHETPVRRLLLVGSSFGARLMLQAAPDVPQAEAVAMITAPIFLRSSSVMTKIRTKAGRALGLFGAEPGWSLNAAEQDRKRRFVTGRKISPAFARALPQFVKRGHVYFLNGELDFITELRHALKRLKIPADRYQLDVVPGALHSFRTIRSQEVARERIVSWCARQMVAPVSPSR